jgi:glutathione S-transferase
MQYPVLYSFRRCPYAIRARLAILVSGLLVELREISLANKPAMMTTASPKATIPVMVLPDGTVLEESLDIMAYALGHNDPDNWLYGALPAAMAQVSLVDDVFKNHLDHYKYPNQYDGDPIEHRNRGMAILAAFDATLARQGYLGGNAFSQVDAAILPFVRQFWAVDPVWFADQPVPALKGWLTAFLDSPLFADAMVTNPVWRDGDPTTIFPSLPR